MQEIRFADYVAYIFHHLNAVGYSSINIESFTRDLLKAGGASSHKIDGYVENYFYKFVPSDSEKARPLTIPIIHAFGGKITRKELTDFLLKYIQDNNGGNNKNIIKMMMAFGVDNADPENVDLYIDILCTQFHEFIKTQKPVMNIVPDECKKYFELNQNLDIANKEKLPQSEQENLLTLLATLNELLDTVNDTDFSEPFPFSLIENMGVENNKIADMVSDNVFHNEDVINAISEVTKRLDSFSDFLIHHSHRTENSDYMILKWDKHLLDSIALAPYIDAYLQDEIKSLNRCVNRVTILKKELTDSAKPLVG